MKKELRLLLVEDAELDASLLTNEIRRAGYDVRSLRVETKQDFLSALDSEEWDLILCDYYLPDFNAVTAVQLLRKRELDIPFIVTSASIGEETAVETMKAGADDYVMKGNLKRLVPAIERELRDAAERRERRKLARESNMLAHAVKSVRECVSITDENNTILFVNDSFLKTYQYDRGELIGKNISIVRPEQYAVDEMEDMLRSTKEGGWEGELLNKRKDGSVFPIRLSTSSIKGQDGRFIALIRVAEDITERKRAEKALRDSEVRYRRLFEAARDGILILDSDTGMVVDVNPFLVEMLGYTREALLGKKIWELGVFKDIAANKANFLELQQKEHIKYENLPLETAGGKPINVEFVSHVYQVDRHNVIQCNIHDITERRRREEELVIANKELIFQNEEKEKRAAELTASEEQFRLITENATDLIAVLDLEGRRIYNSPSYYAILGDPVSLRGTDSFQEVHPDDREKITAIFAEIVRTGVGKRAEFRFLLKDGSIRHIQSQLSVIRGRQGNVSQVVVVSRDVTEKKNLEAQYLRAQRMESLGTLAGGIAHDLNNVLAPIVLSIDVLKRRFSDAQSLKMLTTIESSAFRGRDIIKQVLTFARGVEGERSLVQLRHLISETNNIMQETFPKSIECVCDAPKNLWPLLGDSTQLHQVMMNLSVNARDAMPNGGRLKLSAENLVIDEHYAGMHLNAKAGRYIVIKVEDTGRGIPQEYLEKIFEPFFTTKELGKGTGLGLATAHSIVQSHGGFINVYSEPGKGTEFKVYLPAVEGEAAKATGEEKESLPTGDGELILVVDDETSILDITRQTLETFGYRVLVAQDGTEAVALYAQNRDNVSVVLTDMMMPVMDGASTIRVLQKMNPAVKIIAASGMGSGGSVPKNAGFEVQAFLQKPYGAEVLLKTVRDVLKKE